jgi:hypothetical protein
MRRSGTDFRGRSSLVWLWLLCLCASACGDSVVVAREFSLVSAAVESQDAGSDAEGQSGGPHFNFGHGGSGPLGPHAQPPFGGGGSVSKDPHDKSGTGGGGAGGSSAKNGTSKHP